MTVIQWMGLHLSSSVMDSVFLIRTEFSVVLHLPKDKPVWAFTTVSHVHCYFVVPFSLCVAVMVFEVAFWMCLVQKYTKLYLMFQISSHCFVWVKWVRVENEPVSPFTICCCSRCGSKSVSSVIPLNLIFQLKTKALFCDQTVFVAWCIFVEVLLTYVFVFKCSFIQCSTVIWAALQKKHPAFLENRWPNKLFTKPHT